MEPAFKGYFTFEIVYGVIKKSAKLLRFHSLHTTGRSQRMFLFDF